MNRVIKLNAFIGLLLLALSSCKKESIATYDVDAAFEPYVQLFIAEGAKRGHEIDFNDTGLLVEFSDKIVDDASGYCYLGQYHIVIDKAEWNILTDNQKEFLLLHELGHCELNRGHRNDQFINKLWKSMMRGDPLSGTQKYQPVAFYGFRKNYYLDELFNEQTPAPNWADSSFKYTDVSEAEKETIFEKTNLNRVAEQLIDPGKNFEIELKMSGIATVPYITGFSWSTSSHYFYVNNFRNFGTFIGVYKNGKEQHLHYDPTNAEIGGSEFNKITARQLNGTTQLFFNDQFIFHLDEFPEGLSYLRCEAKNINNNLVTSFKIDLVRLSRLP